MTRVVQRSKEIERIIALSRRKWPVDLAAELAERLTVELRTPTGTMTLRPIQAVALAELRALGGVFSPIRVGGGKTLVSLLAATVLGSARPILLVPAKLRDKTRRDLDVLRRHWRISPAVRVESYETLGREKHAEMLAEWKPDLVVCDEAHRIKNFRAAVTRRVLRALQGGKCHLVALSGTITRRSVRDYAHLLTLSLGEACTPVPTTWTELEDWADALDETKNDTRTVEVGALSMLRGPEEEDVEDPITACRRAFRRRLVDTPGVVATDESQLGVSLSLVRVAPPIPREVSTALAHLRMNWELPDGTPIADGIAVWRHARELALGFWYKWDPAPPQDWLAARREWCSACREILSENRTHLDSELQVVKAIDSHGAKAQLVGACECERGEAIDERTNELVDVIVRVCAACRARAENASQALHKHRISPEMYRRGAGPLARWRAVKDTFRPNTVPVWVDEFALDYCVGRAKHEAMLVWVEHRAVAAALEARGMPFYGAQGRNRAGQVVEDADPGKSIALSMASNGEGRNLQAWCRNLVTSPPASGSTWEQLLGRTHREGQEADEVEAWWFATCLEHDGAMEQALRDAAFVEETTGQLQKIIYASRR